MRIALTGGTGFIGSHFIRQALAEGHSVLCIRRTPSSRPRIQLNQHPIWLNKQLDKVSANDLIGYDVLVHLATHTGNPPYDTIANCLRWNLIAVIDLFNQARLAGIQRFIVAGSCFEYGLSGANYNEIPTVAPLLPTSSYAASKATASTALAQWANEHGLSLDILRVFHVYGEGEESRRFWPLLCQAAQSNKDFMMTAGEQVRDFQPVSRVSKAFLKRATCMAESITGANIFNLSTLNYQSLATFAASEWKRLKAPGKIRLGEVPYRCNEVMRYVPGDCLIEI